jgi:hypothetical protein
MQYMKKYITKKNLTFIAIFAVFGFLALQVPVTQLVGSEVKFTVYDAFAPIAGSFIGAVPGVIAVFFMQFFNFLIHGADVVDAGTIIRFFPMLFAAFYFAKKRRFNLVVPIIAIIAFIAHPIGREVWYFTLFWLIPIVAYFFREQFLFARALGATFTAHAVGGTLWIWTFALPATLWHSLIPIVAMERLVFALGITGSFIVVNNLLYFLEKKNIFNLGFLVEEKYLARFLRDADEAKARSTT